MSQQYNPFEEADMAIKAAQQMIGAATMSMDKEQLEDAKDALSKAKIEFNHAKKGLDATNQSFFDINNKIIQEMEHQLSAASDH